MRLSLLFPFLLLFCSVVMAQPLLAQEKAKDTGFFSSFWSYIKEQQEVADARMEAAKLQQQDPNYKPEPSIFDPIFDPAKKRWMDHGGLFYREGAIGLQRKGEQNIATTLYYQEVGFQVEERLKPYLLLGSNFGFDMSMRSALVYHMDEQYLDPTNINGPSRTFTDSYIDFRTGISFNLVYLINPLESGQVRFFVGPSIDFGLMGILPFTGQFMGFAYLTDAANRSPACAAAADALLLNPGSSRAGVEANCEKVAHNLFSGLSIRYRYGVEILFDGFQVLLYSRRNTANSSAGLNLKPVYGMQVRIGW